MTDGLTVDEEVPGMMHIYHLYGAHSPYYLTEDATLDYNTNPIAQWKGCFVLPYRKVKMGIVSVSIIVPIFKVEKYLVECLDSLVKQTLDDIELELCV